MRLLVLALLAFSTAANAGEWRLQRIDTPARVTAIDIIGGEPRVSAGGLWYRIDLSSDRVALAFVDTPKRPALPDNALPDGQVARGTRDIARVWLAAPTERYGHGVLGNATEAASVVIERADGQNDTVALGNDAVFEDLTPRLADFDGDGQDEIVVVKSYLKRGAALAVIALRKGRYRVVAETPPLGAPNRWLNPAGIGDFNGDGKVDIALVRQPHVVGELELWTYDNARLRKSASLAGFSNHISGSRALAMSAVADFDDDGTLDIALPSLDRTRLRTMSFKPDLREIASIPLPADAATGIVSVARGTGPPALALGLADGSLVILRRD